MSVPTSNDSRARHRTYGISAWAALVSGLVSAVAVALILDYVVEAPRALMWSIVLSIVFADVIVFSLVRQRQKAIEAELETRGERLRL